VNPVTHFLLSWCIANTLPESSRRDRAIITVAGIAPDFDGFGIVGEYLTSNSKEPLLWWTDYHHVLGHNLGAAIVATCLAAIFARKRFTVAMFVLLTFHLHLFCDIIGARGPDGDQWPIPYLLPFSHAWELSWNGQWALNGWQNIAISVATIAATFLLAWKRGYSPLEMVSHKADRIFVEALRNRVKP